jgi:hypothetical protein
MLYIAYLDEFGHSGPYISHDHPTHHTHPAFGIGGFVLPYYKVRSFSTFFFQLKKQPAKNRAGQGKIQCRGEVATVSSGKMGEKRLIATDSEKYSPIS